MTISIKQLDKDKTNVIYKKKLNEACGK